MKHTILVLTCLLTLAAGTSLLGQGRITTITLETIGLGNKTNILEIGYNEVAEVISYELNSANTSFVKDNKEYFLPAAGRRAVIAGPATIQINGFGNTDRTFRSFLTVQITPESFPPDKTVIIPDGTTGATITMECSTNLINWTTATNGFYTGSNSAKFFRIRAERAP